MLYHYLEWELNVDPVTLLHPVHTPLRSPASNYLQPCNVGPTDHKDQMADHLSGMLRHYLEWELNIDPVTLLCPVHTALHLHTPLTLAALNYLEPCNVRPADHLTSMLCHYLEWELNVDPVTLLGPAHAWDGAQWRTRERMGCSHNVSFSRNFDCGSFPFAFLFRSHVIYTSYPPLSSSFSPHISSSSCGHHHPQHPAPWFLATLDSRSSI
jgi:hypothetical protein